MLVLTGVSRGANFLQRSTAAASSGSSLSRVRVCALLAAIAIPKKIGLGSAEDLNLADAAAAKQLGCLVHGYAQNNDCMM